MSTAVLENTFEYVFDVSTLKMTDEKFYEFCQRNKDYRFELNAEGELEFMPPTNLETSDKNSEINFQLRDWTKKDDSGKCFESDGMFTLPNGAKRAPDAFWISKEKYFALSEKEREEGFAKIVPDFVIELRSKSDNLKKLKDKMLEYIENGVRLSWLIDPAEKRIYIYRINGEIEILENPSKVSGENVLNGFELDLTEIF
ncbi:MAG: Uma2 family endonuclease [Pyrinomonadaceae bacterium]